MKLIVSETSSFVRKYFTYISDSLKSSLEDHADIIFVDDNNLYCHLNEYCAKINDEKDKMWIVLGSDRDAVCSNIIKVITRSSTITRPGILLLSTLLTGYKFSSDAMNFENRISHELFYSNYVVENKLYNYSKLFQFPLVILGIGLLYGNNGLDFQSILNSIYNNEDVVLSKITSNISILPKLHISDLSNIIVKELTKLDNLNEPTFIVCSDGENLALHDLIHFISMKVNNAAANISFSEESPVDEVFRHHDIDVEDILKWQISYPINTEKSSLTFNSHFDIIWSEFLRASNLQSCQLMIIGPPFSGKSAVANEVATKLNLEYLTASTIISCYLMTESTINEDLKSELCTSILKLSVDPKKSKKDDTPLDITKIEISQKLCSTIEKSLLLRVIKQYLVEKCSRKGYVLDIWDLDIIDSFEILNVDSEKNIGLEMIVDIQCESEIILNRYMSSMGLSSKNSKVSKDQQNAIKQLQHKIDSYNMKLQGYDNLKHHPSTIEVLNSTKETKPKVIQLNNESVEETCNFIIEQFLEVHGDIGWYKSSLTQSIVTYVKDEEMSSSVIEKDQQSIEHDQSLNKVFDDKSLSFEDKAKLDVNLIEIQEFLSQTVLPYVAEALVDISTLKPADSLKYLYEYLLRKADEIEEVAKNEALDNYIRVIRETELKYHKKQ